MSHDAVRTGLTIAYIAFAIGMCVGVACGMAQTVQNESPCMKRARMAAESRKVNES